MKLSAVIITKNEERNIARCLGSLGFVDEILVIDTGSADRTIDIAREHNAIVHSIKWSGFGAAKQHGVDIARGEWVLSIDADEEVSQKLADEIKAVIADDRVENGFSVPRRTNFLGRWIGHCGWYPDRVMRLFRKEFGGFDLAIVHEKVVVSGSVGCLNNDLLHYSFPDLEIYFAKANHYTSIGADKLHLAGRKCHWYDLLFRPPLGFVKSYLIKQGFRDGWEGLMISCLSAQSVFNKYCKLRAKRSSSTKVVADE